MPSLSGGSVQFYSGSPNIAAEVGSIVEQFRRKGGRGIVGHAPNCSRQEEADVKINLCYTGRPRPIQGIIHLSSLYTPQKGESIGTYVFEHAQILNKEDMFKMWPGML